MAESKEKTKETGNEKSEGSEAKKRVLLGVIALIVGIAIIALVIWFSNMPHERQNEIILKEGTILPSGICSELPKVMVIHQAGCSACAVALPRLQELEQELNQDFKYYDLAIDNNRKAIFAMGLIPQVVPTIIINCKVYIGARSKEEYKDLITSQNKNG
ncbi:MAG: hypothetical protein K6T16_02415 [Candidatus Pacearchaeota archaeon]|nr:hypothetical protein [Candidatus Pacearchaeota archaeon]